jgi:ATP-binding cassette subfamily C exporter for protease/lipase
MKIFTFMANQPDNVLSRALKEAKRPLLVAAIFSFFSNILYMAMPLYTFQVYGRVLISQSVPTLVVLTGVTLFVFSLSSVIDDYRARILINYGILLDQRVSGRIFSGLFDAAVRGDPSARAQVLRDLDQFRTTLTGIAAAAFFDLPWIPVFLGVLYLIDPLVGVVTTVGAVALLALALAQERMMRPTLRESNEAQLKSYAFTDAALRNGEVVRAMGMLPTLGAAWAKYRAVTIERGAAASEISNAFTNIIKAVRMAVQILIIAIGAYLILKGKIHSGMLFANMILASRALAPIEKIVASWDPLNNMARAHERLTALLAQAEPKPAATALPRPKGKLSVEAVNFAPMGAQKLLLGNINFALDPGEVLGVIGPSGAGKSTLARLLVGIWKPINGVVRLDGADVFSWDRADFGRHVGYLPQDTELFAGTIRDNIAYGREGATMDEIVAAAVAAHVDPFVRTLPGGYDTVLDEDASNISAGQRQLVTIARAFLADPAVLILDEATSNVDTRTEVLIQQAMARLRHGRTSFVIAHRLSTIRNADEIVVMDKGRIVEQGTHTDLLARRGFYRELYESQFAESVGAAVA